MPRILRPTVTCEICPSTFKMGFSYNRQLRQVHKIIRFKAPRNAPQFECKLCHKMRNRNQKANHIRWYVKQPHDELSTNFPLNITSASTLHIEEGQTTHSSMDVSTPAEGHQLARLSSNSSCPSQGVYTAYPFPRVTLQIHGVKLACPPTNIVSPLC